MERAGQSLCSFCGEITAVINGPAVCICEPCARLVLEIFGERKKESAMNEQSVAEVDDDDDTAEEAEEVVAMELLSLLNEAAESGECPETFAEEPFHVGAGYDPGTFDVRLLDGSVFAVQVTRVRRPKKSKPE